MGHYAPPSGRSVAIQIVRTPAQCFIVGEAAERPILPPSLRRCRNVCRLLKSSFQKADSLYAVPLKNINLFQNFFTPFPHDPSCKKHSTHGEDKIPNPPCCNKMDWVKIFRLLSGIPHSNCSECPCNLHRTASGDILRLLLKP